LPPKDEEENNIINILSQPIWLNFNIKRNDIFGSFGQAVSEEKIF
jgi:hypothetical protein